MAVTTDALIKISLNIEPALLSLADQLQWIALAAKNAGDAFAKALASVEDAARQIRLNANTPTGVAGLEGRYYVLGGLDPGYAAPEHLDLLVSEILSGTALGCWSLTPANRAAVAAAAIRGYARHRRGQIPSPAGIAWGRLIGDTRVLVSREAS